MTQGAKRTVLAMLTHFASVPYWRPLVNNVVTLFMLHRFADAHRGVDGVSADDLRNSLAFLRRERFQLVGLGDLLAGATTKLLPNRPSVVFTVDDGYVDFASAAAPIFAEFDCPVTVFLTTGPVDDRTWFWWDRVEFMLDATEHSHLQFDLGSGPASWQWSSAPERRRAAVDITNRLKTVSNDEKHAALASLASQLDVEVPATPPPRYAAMSWDDVRQCAASGVTFAPHTVTHPILTQVGADQAEWEIGESWRRLSHECDATVPVFSYPNGVFSEREVDLAARCGLAGAVTTKPYYASPNVLRDSSSPARFRVPRFEYPPGDRTEFVSVVTGLDRVNAFLREGRVGWRCVG